MSLPGCPTNTGPKVGVLVVFKTSNLTHTRTHTPHTQKRNIFNHFKHSAVIIQRYLRAAVLTRSGVSVTRRRARGQSSERDTVVTPTAASAVTSMLYKRHATDSSANFISSARDFPRWGFFGVFLGFAREPAVPAGSADVCNHFVLIKGLISEL